MLIFVGIFYTGEHIVSIATVLRANVLDSLIQARAQVATGGENNIFDCHCQLVNATQLCLKRNSHIKTVYSSIEFIPKTDTNYSKEKSSIRYTKNDTRSFEVNYTLNCMDLRSKNFILAVYYILNTKMVRKLKKRV